MTTNGPYHLASNLELGGGRCPRTLAPCENRSHSLPLLYRCCWCSWALCKFSCDSLQSVWSFALRSRTFWISFSLGLGPSSQLSLTRSYTPCGLLPKSSSKGENAVEAWGTSHTANNRGSSHLSQLCSSLWMNLRIVDFHVLFSLFTRPSVCGW